MPLPPLPDNNTDRAWLKYTSGGIEHEMQFRLLDTATQQTYIDTANMLADALKAFMHTGDAFIGLRHSDSGSTLSFPLDFTAVPGLISAAYTPVDKANFVALSGRSLAGYRCRITFFSPFQSEAGGYRVVPQTAGPAQALYNAVTTSPAAFRAKDGLAVVWNPYVNQGMNAYWQRELRTAK